MKNILAFNIWILETDSNPFSRFLLFFFFFGWNKQKYKSVEQFIIKQVLLQIIARYAKTKPNIYVKRKLGFLK